MNRHEQRAPAAAGAAAMPHYVENVGIYLVGSECGLFAICTNFAFKSPDRIIIGRAMARWKALEL